MTPPVVLILGGTTEARHLAEQLCRELPAIRVISSLAGRVSAPRFPPGEVRVGGFGGPEGLAAWLREHRVAAVVDATHPFAARMSVTAAATTRSCAVPLLALRRPGWQQRDGDVWHWVDSVPAAADLVGNLAARVLLTVGRQELGAFAADHRTWFLARCVEEPEPPLPPRVEMLLDRGPYTLAAERALLRDREIAAIVTKDSGGAATAAKLAAARELARPVVMVRRPPSPAGVSEVADAASAVAWIRSRLGE